MCFQVYGEMFVEHAEDSIRVPIGRFFKEPFSVSIVIRYCLERRDACLGMPKTIRNVRASFD